MAIGIDLVYIPRFINKEELAARVLSPNELLIYQTRVKKAEFLAGRFAAKEAFLKAYKDGIGKIPFHLIDVVYLESGRPEIIFNQKHYPVSISHDGDYAIAIVEVVEE